jgi:hypothetical protein
MILTHEQIHSIVKKMEGVTAEFAEMAEATGIKWSDISDTVKHKAKQLGIDGKGQQIVNFMLLSAAIGYAYAKGERFDVDTTTSH